VKSLENPECKAEILERIGKLQLDSPRLWGKMNVAQMVCHLSDSFLGVMGERTISPARGFYPRAALKCLALYAPFRWPKGVQTRPEVNQEIGGTPPAEFEEDKRHLLALVERFAATPRSFHFQPHPMFKEMSDRDWMRWGYLHPDHHLRQFGS
jgi:hypothetical protein